MQPVRNTCRNPNLRGSGVKPVISGVRPLQKAVMKMPHSPSCEDKQGGKGEFILCFMYGLACVACFPLDGFCS